MSIEAMKQALEALESYHGYMEPLTTVFGGPRVPAEQSTTGKVEKAITALRTAIEQAMKQEPVATVRTWHKNGDQHAELACWELGLFKLPDGEHTLYTTPPAAPVQDDMPKIGCVNHDCDKCKAAAPVQELEKAAAMALDAIAASGDFLFNWHDCEPNNEREMDGYSEVLALNEKAFNALRKCLLTPAAQRQWVGLSEEEIDKLKHLIDWTATWSHGRFAYEIEQLLKEKNA